MVEQPAGTGVLGVPEGPEDTPLGEQHCVGLGACSPRRKGKGAGATSLPAPGGACAISDVTVWEQGDLVASHQSHSYALVLA